MVELPEMEKRHRDHGSAVIDNRCMVISGMLTRTCEAYNFTKEEWSVECKLPKRLKLFATTASFGCIYLSGGVKAISHKPTKHIWKYCEGIWSTLDLQLPYQLSSHLMFQI